MVKKQKKKPTAKRLEKNREEQRAKFVAKVDHGKKLIQSEVKKFGEYPENGGKLTTAEFCRRAEIPQQTLHHINHKTTTLVEVKEFIRDVLPKGTKPKTGRAKTQAKIDAERWKEKFEGANKALNDALQERNLYELQLIEANSKIETLEGKLKKNAKRS